MSSSLDQSPIYSEIYLTQQKFQHNEIIYYLAFSEKVVWKYSFCSLCTVLCNYQRMTLCNWLHSESLKAQRIKCGVEISFGGRLGFRSKQSGSPSVKNNEYQVEFWLIANDVYAFMFPWNMNVSAVLIIKSRFMKNP